jgi:hypothetical protein
VGLSLGIPTRNLQPETRDCHSPTPWARLDRSGAAEADRHLAGFEDNGDIALAVREPEHAVKPRVVAQDVDIFEGNFALRVSLTGFACVRSEILTEDENLFHKKIRER